MLSAFGHMGSALDLWRLLCWFALFGADYIGVLFIVLICCYLVFLSLTRL